MNNRITKLFNIEYPIVQAGMIWCDGWELASAVSNAGGLGLIGSGSMYPDILRAHIRKCKAATDKLFGVNVPLIYPDIDKHIQIVIDEGVKIVFTSAGNPKTWTPVLKEHGITVVHVVANAKFAMKAKEAGAENLAGVQFIHRSFAWILVMLIGFYWYVSIKFELSKCQRMTVNLLGGVLIYQFLLGVFTLLYSVPVLLGVLHQMGAFFLFSAAIFLTHQMKTEKSS